MVMRIAVSYLVWKVWSRKIAGVEACLDLALDIGVIGGVLCSGVVSFLICLTSLSRLGGGWFWRLVVDVYGHAAVR